MVLEEIETSDELVFPTDLAERLRHHLGGS